MASTLELARIVLKMCSASSKGSRLAIMKKNTKHDIAEFTLFNPFNMVAEENLKIYQCQKRNSEGNSPEITERLSSAHYPRDEIELIRNFGIL